MYRLYSFAQSGNSFKVAFLLNQLGQPWQAEFVDFFSGLSRDKDWRAEHNEMGEIPILIDGDLQLTQSGVILDYLAHKHQQYGGRDEAERREILRWILFDNHKFTSYFASYRFMKSFGPSAPDPAVMAWLKSRAYSAFGIVNQHLAERQFMLGDYLSIADFSLSAYLFYPAEESGLPVSEEFPHIAAWIARLKQLPGWRDPYEMMPGQRLPVRW